MANGDPSDDPASRLLADAYGTNSSIADWWARGGQDMRARALAAEGIIPDALKFFSTPFVAPESVLPTKTVPLPRKLAPSIAQEPVFRGAPVNRAPGGSVLTGSAPLPRDDNLPWNERLPRPQPDSNYRFSPWSPVEPDMGVRDQVWHPDFLKLPKPTEIDEHGYYTAGGDGLLSGLRLKSIPPPTYADPSPADDLLRALSGMSGRSAPRPSFPPGSMMQGPPARAAGGSVADTLSTADVKALMPPSPYEQVMQQARGLQAGMLQANPIEMAIGLLGPRAHMPAVRAYHGMSGSLKGGKFDPKQFGRNHKDDTGGVFLTSDPQEAGLWAELAGVGRGGEAIVPADVGFKNPMRINAGDVHPTSYWYENKDQLRAAAAAGGHDGVVVSGPDRSTMVALQPNTVHSATTGNTLFSLPIGAASLAAILSQYDPEKQ